VTGGVPVALDTPGDAAQCFLARRGRFVADAQTGEMEATIGAEAPNGV
jgi:hypothetical protein